MLPETNFLAVLLAALVPTVVGFLYYNPKTVGGAWMKASGMTEEKIKSGNMLVILLASLLLSFLMAFIMVQMVIHQTDLYSIFAGKPGMDVEGSEVMNAINEVLRLGGDNFRTFGHGALHGTLVGVFLTFPVLAITGLFERRPFKLALINGAYWTITLAIMGGILCQMI
jgi:hypothetical protein